MTIPNWGWLALGALAGFYVARHGGGGLSVNFAVGATSGPPPGAGITPLDQPTGSTPYETIGSYNSQFSSGFPDLISPGDQAVIVNGGAIS